MPPIGLVVWNGSRSHWAGPYLVSDVEPSRPAPAAPVDAATPVQAHLRRQVLRLLETAPMTGAALTDAIGWSPSAVHLAISALRSHGKVVVVDRVMATADQRARGGRSVLNVYGLAQ